MAHCPHCQHQITSEDKKKGWFFEGFCSATCRALWNIERGR